MPDLKRYRTIALSWKIIYGKRKGKQNHICVTCGRQFIDRHDPLRGYSDEVKRECLLMYTNGMGFRAIERVKGVHHTTVIHWVKQVGGKLPDAYEPDKIPDVGELSGTRNICRVEKTKSGSGAP